MTYRFWFIAIVFLAACGGAPENAQLGFPRQLSGGWTLAGEGESAAADVPARITEMGLARATGAVYDGPGKLSVRLYRMNSWSGAFEVAQTWRAEAGKLAFHTEAGVGPYFVVLEGGALEHAALEALAEELERHWTGQSQ